MRTIRTMLKYKIDISVRVLQRLRRVVVRRAAQVYVVHLQEYCQPPSRRFTGIIIIFNRTPPIIA